MTKALRGHSQSDNKVFTPCGVPCLLCNMLPSATKVAIAATAVFPIPVRIVSATGRGREVPGVSTSQRH